MSVATNKQTIAQSRISASIDGKAKVSVDVTKTIWYKTIIYIYCKNVVVLAKYLVTTIL